MRKGHYLSEGPSSYAISGGQLAVSRSVDGCRGTECRLGHIRVASLRQTRHMVAAEFSSPEHGLVVGLVGFPSGLSRATSVFASNVEPRIAFVPHVATSSALLY